MMTIPVGNVQQGWQCPICKLVHAPFVRSCGCAQGVKINPAVAQEVRQDRIEDIIKSRPPGAY